MLYSINWPEWKLEERLVEIKRLGIHCTYDSKYGTLETSDAMSSGEREAFEFLRDPVHPVKFHIFDTHFGREILRLHNEFWTWRFYPDGR